MNEIIFDGSEASALTQDPELRELMRELGPTETRRYSHIWPKRPALRLAFRFLRSVTRERGPISDWTRRWKCRWEVRLAESSDVVRHESEDRADCVRWEKENLGL